MTTPHTEFTFTVKETVYLPSHVTVCDKTLPSEYVSVFDGGECVMYEGDVTDQFGKEHRATITIAPICEGGLKIMGDFDFEDFSIEEDCYAGDPLDDTIEEVCVRMTNYILSISVEKGEVKL